eukprot:gene11489-21705_t
MGDPCHKLTFSRKVGSKRLDSIDCGLKEIKLSNAKDLVTRGFDVVPGQKLCPSCTIRMNETKNDPIHAAEPDEAFEEDFDKEEVSESLYQCLCIRAMPLTTGNPQYRDDGALNRSEGYNEPMFLSSWCALNAV